MSIKNITIAICITVTAALIGWDLVPALNSMHGDTISEVMLYGSQRYIIIPGAWGVIIGHWLAVRRPGKPIYMPWWSTLICLSCFAVFLIGFNIFSHYQPNAVYSFLQHHPIAVFFPSMVLGHFSWSQDSSLS